MDENNADKMRKIKRPTETNEWRISNIEKHNNIRRIEANGLSVVIDNENGVITFYDDNDVARAVLQGQSITFYDANGENPTEIYNNNGQLISTTNFASTGNLIAFQEVSGTTIKGVHKSSDGTQGYSGEAAIDQSGVGSFYTLLTIKDGIITNVQDINY